MSSAPIVIVGAGPTGVLLACELARRGIEVRIIDKAPAAANESRAGGVHSRTLELFHRLGIADELVSAGNPVGAFNVSAGGRRVLRVDFGRLDGPFPFMLHVPQYETQRVLDTLLRRLGVEIERGVELDGLQQGAGGVVLTTRQGGLTSTLPAAHVVGCDGAHSTVRHELGLRFEGQGYGQDWIGADVEVDWAYPESEAQVFASRAGVLACFPFGGGRWRVIAPQVADRAEERARPDLDEVRALVNQRGPAGVVISNPSWLGAFRAARRSAPHYRAGRVFLAGDAVHIHSPAAGQGMNTGLGDAANLGWKLALVAAGRAPEELLDTYETERAPVARQVIALTHSLVRLFGNPPLSPPARWARDHVLPPVSQARHAQAEIAARFGQHRVSYRTSPLSAGSGRSGLRPGDRAPDASVPLPGGGVTSAFELFRHPGHTAFVAPSHRDPTPLGSLSAYHDDLRVVAVEPAQALARRYGLKAGRACVVRPDGYVGYLGPAAGVSGYLSRIALRGTSGTAASAPPVDLRHREAEGPGLLGAAGVSPGRR